MNCKIKLTRSARWLVARTEAKLLIGSQQRAGSARLFHQAQLSSLGEAGPHLRRRGGGLAGFCCRQPGRARLSKPLVSPDVTNFIRSSVMSRRCENTPGAVKRSRLDPAAAFLDANVSNAATEDVGSSCDCLQLASSVWQVRMLRLQGSVFRGPEPGWSWRQAGWENRISLPTVCRPVM